MLLACGKSPVCLQVVRNLIEHFSFAEHTYKIEHSGVCDTSNQLTSNMGIVGVSFNNLSKCIEFSTWKSACCDVLGSHFCNSSYIPSTHSLKFSIYTEPELEPKSLQHTQQALDAAHEKLKQILTSNMSTLQTRVTDFKINVDASNLQFAKGICTVWTTRNSLNLEDCAQNIDAKVPFSDECNLQIEVEADTTDILSSSAALLPMQFSDFVIQLDIQSHIADYDFALFFASLNGMHRLTLCVEENQARIACSQPQRGNLLKHATQARV